MHKYVVTKENIYSIAGRLRKFFNSCQKDGVYDYKSPRKNFRPLDGSSARISYPVQAQVRIAKIPSPTKEYNLMISIGSNQLLTSTVCRIGDIVYFNGGNMVIVKNVSFNRLLNKHYADVYIRRDPHAGNHMRASSYSISAYQWWAGGLVSEQACLSTFVKHTLDTMNKILCEIE